MSAPTADSPVFGEMNGLATRVYVIRYAEPKPGDAGWRWSMHYRITAWPEGHRHGAWRPMSAAFQRAYWERVCDGGHCGSGIAPAYDPDTLKTVGDGDSRLCPTCHAIELAEYEAELAADAARCPYCPNEKIEEYGMCLACEAEDAAAHAADEAYARMKEGW